MDCFVATRLAMTMIKSKHTFAIPRRKRPGRCENLSPHKRGRGGYRVRAAPAVSCAKCTSKCAHEHTGSAETLRHPPRNGFTAYGALSPATNSFLSPSL